MIKTPTLKKETRNYNCGYCNTTFTRNEPTKSEGGKHRKISTQIQCPKCGNFLKTW